MEFVCYSAELVMVNWESVSDYKHLSPDYTVIGANICVGHRGQDNVGENKAGSELICMCGNIMHRERRKRTR